jgi:Arc/MetJ-type ribon-helix-helix transcriptional regulator
MSKPVQMTLRLSPELWSLMQQVMGKTTYKSVNEFIRTCIRAYIDETGDIIGSRKHFQNRLAERMDRLEAMLLWNALQSQVLTARGMFTVLDELTPDDAEQEPPTPDIQLLRASESSRKLLPKFLAEQAIIVNELEQYQRKQRKERAAQGEKTNRS